MIICKPSAARELQSGILEHVSAMREPVSWGGFGWIPENGYWEVITTLNQPKMATVRFFDLDRYLVYEEQITGIVLDLHKRSVCRRLNRSLQAALAAWGKNKQLITNRGIVAMNMRR